MLIYMAAFVQISSSDKQQQAFLGLLYELPVRLRQQKKKGQNIALRLILAALRLCELHADSQTCHRNFS